MADSIESFLREQFVAHGYTGDGGQARLRTLLSTRYGVDVTAQAVSLWFKGKRSPHLKTLLPLLDLLDVHGDRRTWAINLAADFCGETKPDDASTEAA